MARTQNLTVRLEKQVIRKAKTLATSRGTSISRLVAAKIVEAVGDADAEAEAYALARVRALALMERGYALGLRRRPSRGELHARR